MIQSAPMRRSFVLYLVFQWAALTVSAAEWKLIWSDEFEGPAGSPVESSKWTAEVGGNGWGNQELEYYKSDPANAHLDGSGNLVIVALKEARGTYQTRFGNGNYSSARLITKGKFEFMHGRVEARIQIPSGKGLWPAFWMLGNDFPAVDWPRCGEVDIMENIGRQPSVVHGTIHGPGYSDDEGPTASYRLPNPEKFSDDFHVYAVEWDANAIRWYVDENLYETRTPADLPPHKPWVFNHPFYLLLNLAVGGDWPGPPNKKTVFPGEMKVDYVRVYQNQS